MKIGTSRRTLCNDFHRIESFWVPPSRHHFKAIVLACISHSSLLAIVLFRAQVGSIEMVRKCAYHVHTMTTLTTECMACFTNQIIMNEHVLMQLSWEALIRLSVELLIWPLVNHQIEKVSMRAAWHFMMLKNLLTSKTFQPWGLCKLLTRWSRKTFRLMGGCSGNATPPLCTATWPDPQSPKVFKSHASTQSLEGKPLPSEGPTGGISYHPTWGTCLTLPPSCLLPGCACCLLNSNY